VPLPSPPQSGNVALITFFEGVHMKLVKLSLFVLALGLLACGGDKSAATGDKAKKASGPDHCAALLKKGTEICNGKDVKKYGADMVTKCLKPFQETVKAGNQTKCKMMTPTGK
jgi:hypothetical protein